MATDTTSPLLGLLLQGTGNNANAWGVNLNNQVFLPLENAIAGQSSINITGGADVTLTAAQARSAILTFQGTLTADQTIIVPATNKMWMIYNSTALGAYSVFVKTPGGTPTQVPSGTFQDYFVFSTGQIYRKDRHRIGTLFYHGGPNPPAGALRCDGTAYKRAKYPDLYNAIGTTWGNNDSTDFKVPPGYDTGRFLRSSTATLAAGTTQSNQNASHSHTGSGTTTTESADHTHTGSGTTATESADHTHAGSGTTNSNNVSHSHTFSGTTSNSLQSLNHSHTIPALVAYIVGNGQSGGEPSRLASPSNGISTGEIDLTGHQHNYSGTTSTQSLNHQHTYSFVTGTASAHHTHSYSFTTSGRSASHTHNFSFTTSSSGSDEARPESLVATLCIWY